MKNWKVVITAILAITALNCFALSQGINGAILSTSMAIIGGLAGFGIAKKL